MIWASRATQVPHLALEWFCREGYILDASVPYHAALSRENTMTLRHHFLVGTVGCFILFVTGLSAQTLQIIDVDGKSTTLTAAQISSLPRVSANAVEHDLPAQFEGVSVASVLAIEFHVY